MKLELDLSADDWKDYARAPVGGLKRVGVLIPREPVGVSAFVRLGVETDDGQRTTVLTPWLVWKAAHRALAERFGEASPEPGPEPEPEPLAEPPAVLAAVADAMAEHARRWGLGPEHEDGTQAGWSDDAEEVRREATAAAVNGTLTWSHAYLEAAYSVMAITDPGELRKALARVAGTAAAWMAAIDGRTDG